ncbi:hypothetical protein NQ315_000479 [Exocentrus adspersus]|uniref:Double jelly roll-like domain-containing protein n=1 Tax=Exocentrus adspersus TaxID=1586481 RepID=A0AAV8VEB1_9CUCU|nr:hypothetical protein NQ315_000479 [Exocentrus adspersus]
MPHISVSDVERLKLVGYVARNIELEAAFRGWELHDHFDHSNLINMKLYLNSEMFPYDNLNINFENNQIATLYDMYAKFQRSYYEKKNEPIFTPSEFKKFTSLVVIDCSHQNESFKSGSVEIRLEFETNKDISPNTTSTQCSQDKDNIYHPVTTQISKKDA